MLQQIAGHWCRYEHVGWLHDGQMCHVSCPASCYSVAVFLVINKPTLLHSEAPVSGEYEYGLDRLPGSAIMHTHKNYLIQIFPFYAS